MGQYLYVLDCKGEDFNVWAEKYTHISDLRPNSKPLGWGSVDVSHDDKARKEWVMHTHIFLVGWRCPALHEAPHYKGICWVNAYFYTFLHLCARWRRDVSFMLWHVRPWYPPKNRLAGAPELVWMIYTDKKPLAPPSRKDLWFTGCSLLW
jgi:hypothetical protein